MASLSLKESKRIFDFNFLKHPNVCRRFVIYAKSALSRFTNSTFLSVEQKLQICCMPPILNHINSRSMQSILDLQFATCQQEVTDRRERTRKGDQRAKKERCLASSCFPHSSSAHSFASSFIFYRFHHVCQCFDQTYLSGRKVCLHCYDTRIINVTFT